MSYSNYQLQLLARMGIDVWTMREVAASESEPAKSSYSNVHANEPSAIDADAMATRSESNFEPNPQTTPPGRPVEGNRIQASGPSFENDALVSLEKLKGNVAGCQLCDLNRSRTNTVFGNGDTDSDWMFIGEAPGKQEDLEGNPFVGRAGKLLDLMISALGMRREDVYVANVLKCRPPNNRDPLPSEVDECEQYLKLQVQLVKPKVIVALGRISAQLLLKTTMPLGKVRGRIHHYGEHRIPLIATYHPAYLLRSPDQKAKAWDDLWFARQLVESEIAAKN
ncbi:MAG: uracil-DNA glycosylase [Gammaproteobacteria bacterium]|nr:uracil-DNA glycosylase [Gammaproteobacteria bacterium]